MIYGTKKIIALIIAGFFSAFIILAITVLPATVKTWLIKEIQQTTGRKTHLQSLEFNPLTMSVTASGFAMEEQGGGPFIGIGRIRASLSPLSIFKRALIVSEVDIDKPFIAITRNSPNRYNFTDILQRLQTGKKPEPQEKNSFSINNITIRGGSADFNDPAVSGGRKHTVRNLEISIPFISNFPYLAEKYISPAISGVVNGAPFSFSGKMKPFSKSMESSVRINLKQLDIPGLVAYSPQKPPARLVAGKLTLDIDLNYRVFSARKPELNIMGLIRLDDMAINLDNGQPLARLPLLEVKASKIDIFQELFQFESVRLDGLELFVSRDERGQWMFAKHMPAEKSAGERKSGESKLSRSAQGARRPLLRISSLALTNSSVHFSDALVKGGFKATVSDISMSMKNYSNAPNTPAEYELSLLMDKEANLHSKGSFSMFPLSLKSSVSLKGMELEKGWPYLAGYLTSPLKGVVDTSLTLDAGFKNGKPSCVFKGSAGIRSFHVIDTVAKEDLLKCKSMRVDEFRGNLEPFSLAIHRIDLNEVYSRIVILKDGTLNLQNLVTRPVPASATVAASAKTERKPPAGARSIDARSAPKQATGATRRRISIDSITIQNGTLAFSDRHLPQRFSTTFHNLGGRVSGMSSDHFRFADVDLRGNLENHSPLRITGAINPLRDDLFVDLKIAFRDIELSPITPYSSAYLGYTVEKGKMFLDLKYHIERKELRSENRVFIDQFSFGDRVESKKATTLPVRLGLALLKDRNGEIHLDVPVTGRTDDPQFNVWRLVFQAFKNLLVEAATSPFSLLSYTFGEGADLSFIQFNHGSSTLAPGEEQKLKALAKALAGRPALKIELKGYVDREKDSEDYRYRGNIHSLAHERSAAVMTYLVKQAGMANERIVLKTDDIYKNPGKNAQTGSRVEVNVVAP